MSDELEQLTVNDAGNSWVDVLPSSVITGYQIQNTNIQARSAGQDDSHVIVVGDDIQVRISGVIDDLGLPFAVKTAVSLTPTADCYIAVIPGTTAIQRSLQLWTGAVTWDAALNCYTADISGTTRRILNWFIQKSGHVAWHTNNPVYVVRLSHQKQGRTFIDETFSRDAFIRGRDLDGSISVLSYAIVSDEFSTPGVFGQGLTFDGLNLISSDRTSDLIYVHDEVSSTILSSFAAPDDTTHDITFDGTNLISNDDALALIYIHDGITSTVLSSFASPTSEPEGLTYDGTNLISSDDVGATIYVHDGITSTILTSFSAPSSDIQGIAYDGINLFSCDTTNTYIYIHDSLSSKILFSFQTSGEPRGLTSLGSGRLANLKTSTDVITVYGNVPWR